MLALVLARQLCLQDRCQVKLRRTADVVAARLIVSDSEVFVVISLSWTVIALFTWCRCCRRLRAHPADSSRRAGPTRLSLMGYMGCLRPPIHNSFVSPLRWPVIITFPDRHLECQSMVAGGGSNNRSLVGGSEEGKRMNHRVCKPLSSTHL